MKINFLVPLAAALIPMVVGMIWYNRKVFGNAWMKATGMTDENAKGANMVLIFGLTLLFSIFIAFSLTGIVIHQLGFAGLLTQQPDFSTPGSESSNFLNKMMEQYGTSYRTFKHGSLHGFLAGITLALPIIGINALFERRGFKYIAINAGYFIVCMALMGGVICAFA
jgi:hypothetical protein